jgi:16S rRNA (uracil1498-N3)-methyltransferase
MPDFRAYCQPTEPAPTEIRLTPGESHHLVTVNRCGRGDPVTAFDGHGREWITECVDPSKSAAVLRVRETRQAKPLPHEITLGQALPKGTTMDDIIRQATEVGAARIVPLSSERTQVHLDGDRQDKKLEKWRLTAIEAAKQCGNPWLPEITPVQIFDKFLARWSPSAGQRSTLATGVVVENDAHPQAAPDYDLKLIASLHAGTTTLKAALAHHRTRHGTAPRKVLWLVGPEGDFSPAEMTAAITAGFQPITLGPLVLRSDTAAVYALSILSYELSNL